MRYTDEFDGIHSVAIARGDPTIRRVSLSSGKKRAEPPGSAKHAKPYEAECNKDTFDGPG